MNQQNLKPFNTWDPEAHRAASSKGGIASGFSRRRKAALYELVYRLLEIYSAQYQLEQELKRQQYNERKRRERAARRERLNGKQ